MADSGQLRDVLIILLAAVAVVSVFRRLRASAVLGYLVAGALIGPDGLGLLGDIEATAGLAQLGVVFLLFAIGLELSVERMLSLRRYAFGLGAAQVVGTTLALWVALQALGLKSGAALIVGAGLCRRRAHLRPRDDLGRPGGDAPPHLPRPGDLQRPGRGTWAVRSPVSAARSCSWAPSCSSA